MPWVIGIDEAGYGPNLGPLVQAAVGLRLPDDDLAGWTVLRDLVRRAHEPDDDRLLIDDSKKVYAGAKGFEKLEQGVRMGLGLGEFLPEHDWASWLANAQSEHSRLNEYEPKVQARLVPAADFNGILDESNSKAVVLARGLIALIQGMCERVPEAQAVSFICDKQGGRNFYAPFLQTAFPHGWVVAERESATESRYRILNLAREVTVLFRPKADGDSVCVALASMVCKFLREVSMKQFNAFWQSHVPDLQPTAGYPVDAKRFYAEIQPAMKKLGIAPDSVWRRK